RLGGERVDRAVDALDVLDVGEQGRDVLTLLLGEGLAVLRLEHDGRAGAADTLEALVELVGHPLRLSAGDAEARGERAAEGEERPAGDRQDGEPREDDGPRAPR